MPVSMCTTWPRTTWLGRGKHIGRYNWLLQEKDETIYSTVYDMIIIVRLSWGSICGGQETFQEVNSVSSTGSRSSLLASPSTPWWKRKKKRWVFICRTSITWGGEYKTIDGPGQVIIRNYIFIKNLESCILKNGTLERIWICIRKLFQGAGRMIIRKAKDLESRSLENITLKTISGDMVLRKLRCYWCYHVIIIFMKGSGQMNIWTGNFPKNLDKWLLEIKFLQVSA